VKLLVDSQVLNLLKLVQVIDKAVEDNRRSEVQEEVEA